ncbi:MAG: hypothetical protein NC310_04960 [Roseburia sp.]|nr:hypothetical protein [Anaeroplasma bactoclasticum]MCM1196410.1 hypothetical protein [Roseburia sp.]MCM1557283.1 hypothetical protein [Anaeroplasma bactoclasticum]
MSKKRDLKRQITESEKEIMELEQKRQRSQSALMAAHVNNVPPAASDVEYFNLYTNLIELERENLRQLRTELDKLKK